MEALSSSRRRLASLAVVLLAAACGGEGGAPPVVTLPDLAVEPSDLSSEDGSADLLPPMPDADMAEVPDADLSMLPPPDLSMEAQDLSMAARDLSMAPQDLSMVKPNPDLSMMAPNPDLSMMAPNPDLSMMAPNPDLSMVMPPADLSMVMPMPDQSMVMPMPDQSMMQPMPDLATPVDLAVRDQSVPSDMVMVVPPDMVVVKDLSVPPDMSVPDMSVPDLSVPPDLRPPPDQVIVDLTPPPDQVVPPDLTIRDLTPPPDLVVKDLATPPDLIVVDMVQPPDLVKPGFTWVFAGSMTGFPKDPSGVAYMNGRLYAPQDGRSWDPANGNLINAPFNMNMNFTRRGFACSCSVNNHQYILGGGGDGVLAAWIEPTFVDANYNNMAVTTPASTLALHNPACAMGNNLCYVIGGTTNPNGPYGTTTTKVFDPVKITFAAGPALPMPMTNAGATTGAGQMMVAGGYCTPGAPCPPKNDPSGMTMTVLDTVYSADALNPVWLAQPSLPSPITGGSLVYLNNRFYLVGGSASAFGLMNQNGVLSFAIGEMKWRSDAAAPGMGTVVAAFTDGTVVLAVVYQNFSYDLYRGTP